MISKVLRYRIYKNVIQSILILNGQKLAMHLITIIFTHEATPIGQLVSALQETVV